MDEKEPTPTEHPITFNRPGPYYPETYLVALSIVFVILSLLSLFITCVFVLATK
jgi:hypothetical protein